MSLLETVKQSFTNQHQATLCTIKQCVDQCPDENWEDLVYQHKFCQAVFHTLFFTDVYLGPNLAALREQPFHQEHAQQFNDYEELEDRQPVHVYPRNFIDRYVIHCRTKAEQVIAAETEDSLAKPCGFEWLQATRAEVYPYIVRHIQHHAAQLILRMRLDGIYQAGWIKSGWVES